MMGTACSQLVPDVVVTELYLRGMSVADTVSRWRRAATPAPRVMILSSVEDDHEVAGALRAGAHGYALKNQSLLMLAEHIRDVAAGEGALAPSVIRRFLSKFATLVPADDVTVDGAVLSTREIEVLRLLANGMSNAEIATALGVGGATVKSHVSRLLTKLGLRDRVQAAAFAYRSGIVQLIPAADED